jgi:hypothetical protein
LSNEKKSRKVGRPKLPKGEAMRRIVPVRFAPDVLKAMESVAKARKQTVSEWIRGTISAALKGDAGWTKTKRTRLGLVSRGLGFGSRA